MALVVSFGLLGLIGLVLSGGSTASAGTGAPTSVGTAAGADGLDLLVTLVPPVSAAPPGPSGQSSRPGRPDRAGGDPVPCAPGSRVVRIDAAGGHTVVSAGLETACDPAVDPTAGWLLLRGRETASAPWRIWRLDLPAAASGVVGPLRALTPPAMSCIRPLVLADGGTAFLCDGDLVRTAPGATGAAGEGDDGAPELVRLTSSAGSLDGAAVLPDGRLLLTTADAAGDPVLLTSQPDGTWTTRWRDEPVAGLVGARPVPPDGLLLAVRDAGSAPGTRLWLGSLTDPFAPLRALGPVGSDGDGASLRDPWPLPGGDLLVAAQPAPGERFRIERLSPRGTVEEVVASLDGDALQPIALVPRPPDTQIPSIVKPELSTGYLVLFDAARSDVPGPAGEIDRSEIAAVRVFPWADGPRAESAVDLEPAGDGSLYLEVPADRPLGIALVGTSGDLLGPAGGPLWVRPNERRACMGCHVSRRYAPPNVRPRALLDPPRWVGWGAERVSPRSEFEEGSH